MQHFTYEARNIDGQLICGVIQADCVEQAGLQLSSRNLFVVRVAVDRKDAPVKTERGRATRTQVAWCMSQLSVMVETGLPLSGALDCLARQASEPRLRTLLKQVSAMVQEGRPLSEAMEEFPRSFPPTLTALIRASEMSGSLGHMLNRSSVYLMNDLRAIKQVRGAVIYPVFTLVLCITVTLFLLTVILPRFAVIFASHEATLPLPTRMLMAMSESLLTYWQAWVVGTLAVMAAALLSLHTSWGRRCRDGMVLSLPVLSHVFHCLYQYRTFRTVGILLEAGVPLVDVVQIIQEVVRNRHYGELWREVDQHIRQGESLSGPLLASTLIPEPHAQMIDVGERSGRLGFVFNRLADYVEEEYNQSVKNAIQLIEPCMILLMGTIVGFVAASLMLPLFKISQVAAH